MLPSLLPIQTILFQLLFLLVAIALEAVALHRYLEISRKTSIDYATAINLLSTVIGWLIFFYLQPYLPNFFKEPLISYILFNSFSFFKASSFNILILLVALLYFTIAYFIKIQSLKGLIFLLNADRISFLETKYEDTPAMNSDEFKEKGNLNLALLWANALSHSAILAILFLRTVLARHNNL